MLISIGALAMPVGLSRAVLGGAPYCVLAGIDLLMVGALIMGACARESACPV